MLRLASAALLITVSILAAFGILLWSDPEAAVLKLRGSPLSVVRSEAVARNGLIHEASRLTTTGGLELEVIVVRPDTDSRVSLVIAAVGEGELFESASEIPASEDCAFALFECELSDTGLLGLRRDADRTTASFLAVLDHLEPDEWVDRHSLQAAGRGAFAKSGALAMRYEPRIQTVWQLYPTASEPVGLRQRLAHLLAFGGSRATVHAAPLDPRAELARGLERLEQQISAGEQ